MSTQYKNVKRIERNDLPTITSDLHLLGIGLNTANDSLYFKRSNGVMIEYTKLGGDASYATLQLTNLIGSGDLVGINITGDLYRTSLADSVLDKSGFDNRTDSDISYNAATREFNISANGTSFGFYSDSIRYDLSGSYTLTADTTTTLQHIYFDGNGDLQIIDTFPDDIILTYAYVAAIMLNPSYTSYVYFGDERHGHIMSQQTHLYLHNTVGMAFQEGLGLTNMDVDGNGNDNSNAQIAVLNGVVWDEDNKFNILDGSPQDLFPLLSTKGLYLSGTDWVRTDATNYPLINTGTGRAAYNDVTSGTLIEVSNNDYVLTHIFATNDVDCPIEFVVGQNEYPTIALAREGATTELFDIYLAGIPVSEFKAIATLIIQTGNTYTNAVKSRIMSVDAAGDEYIDWRFIRTGGAGGAAGTSDSFWSRDTVNGSIYPATITDNIGIGAIPNANWAGVGSLIELNDSSLGAYNPSLFVKDSDGLLYETHNAYYDGANIRRKSGGPSIVRKSGTAIYDISFAGAGSVGAVLSGSSLTSRMYLAETIINFNIDRIDIPTRFSSVDKLNALYVDGGSGAVGIGGQPSNWAGADSVIQLNNNSDYDSSLFVVSADSNLYEGYNVYYDGTNFRRIAGGISWLRRMGGGLFTIEYAPAGSPDEILVPGGAGNLERKVYVSQTQVAFNDSRKDVDTLVSTSASLYSLFVQGDTGCIGFGTNTPLLNVGSTSGDFYVNSATRGVHIENDALGGVSYLILEGNGVPPNGQTTLGANIIMCSNSGPTNSKMMSIQGGDGGVFISSLNDDTTTLNNVARFFTNGNTSLGTADTAGSERLTVNGGIVLGYALQEVVEGTIQYNSSADDFQGLTSTGWKSLTSAATSGSTTSGSTTFYTVEANKTSTQSTNTGASDDQVDYPNELVDDGNNYNTTTSTWTNGATSCHANFAAGIRITAAAAGIITLKLYYNGSSLMEQSVYVATAATVSLEVATNIKMAASETLSVYVNNGTGFAATIQTGAGTYFTATKKNV